MQKITEHISRKRLLKIEDYLDKLFSVFNIDIEFTKHFYDRLNDPRNGKDITPDEVIGTFDRVYKKHAEKLSNYNKEVEAVIIDLNNNLNIPFELYYDKKNKSYELRSKTIMRKKGFTTGVQKRIKV